MRERALYVRKSKRAILLWCDQTMSPERTNLKSKALQSMALKPAERGRTLVRATKATRRTSSSAPGACRKRKLCGQTRGPRRGENRVCKMPCAFKMCTSVRDCQNVGDSVNSSRWDSAWIMVPLEGSPSEVQEREGDSAFRVGRGAEESETTLRH